MPEQKGGWVFISHSHQDIREVRLIRNYLENNGFEPILFFLKCLTDTDEITDLIEREIKAREWFIYADSPHARSSKWVKTERECIEKLKDKQVFVINLNSDLDTQLQQIAHITKQMKVFISCSHSDVALKRKIQDALLARDMLVLSDEDIPVGSSFSQAVSSNIDEASRNGFVLILITEKTANSKFVQMEIQKALDAKGKIVPIFVGGAKLSSELLPRMGDLQGFSIRENPSDGELSKLVDHILHRVEYYRNDFRDSYGYRSAAVIHLPDISRIDNLTFWDCENLECVHIPDTVVYITPDAFEDHPGILVKCHAGSYAEMYCKRHGIRHELTDQQH